MVVYWSHQIQIKGLEAGASADDSFLGGSFKVTRNKSAHFVLGFVILRGFVQSIRYWYSLFFDVFNHCDELVSMGCHD